MIKGIVIGGGVMGNHHTRIYKELGLLSAICETDSSKAKELEDKYEVPCFTDIDKLLDEEPFMASIATPTPTHLALVEKCLDRDVHILLEKPLSETVEKASKIVYLASKSSKILAVGYIERFNPVFQAIQALISDGLFGEIISINIKRVGGIPRSANNIILDLMTHDINLLISIFNSVPDSVTTHQHTNDGIVDSAQTLFSFGSASATCEANWLSPVKIRQLHITGTKGYCEVDLIQQKITCFHTAKVVIENSKFDSFVQKNGSRYIQEISVFHKEPLKEEILAFIKAIDTGDKSLIITAEDALKTQLVTLGAMDNRSYYLA